MTSGQIPEEEDRARDGDLRMLLGWAVLKRILAAQCGRAEKGQKTERGGGCYGK